MRRPAPLPPSGAPDDDRNVEVDDDGSLDPPHVAESPSEIEPEATEPLEPLAPLVPFGARAEAEYRGFGDEDRVFGDHDRATEEDPTDDAEDRPVRLRDVWRASRARRRALRAEMRRFTVRSRRRRIVWISASAALVALVVGSVGAAYSPLFAVREIHVIGAQGPSAAEIESALSGQMGTPLPLVDASEVKAALVAFPQVESYTLEAHPPHELVVRIVERTPIGVVESDAGWSVVDAAGVVMSTTPERPEGVPVITVEGGLASGAFVSLGQVIRALPDDIRGQLVAASATTRDDVTLDLGSGSQVVWGSVEQSPEKVVVLEALMVVHPPGTVGVYDVTSTEAAVVR